MLVGPDGAPVTEAEANPGGWTPGLAEELAANYLAAYVVRMDDAARPVPSQALSAFDNAAEVEIKTALGTMQTYLIGYKDRDTALNPFVARFSGTITWDGPTWMTKNPYLMGQLPAWQPVPSPVAVTAPYVDPILQSIAFQQCLRTPNPNSKKCDPGKVLLWMLQNPGFAETGTGPRYDYQRYYCGLKYTVSGNGVNANPDGVRISDCALLDSKFVGAGDSPRIIGSGLRENPKSMFGFVQSGFDNQADDLFSRYASVLNAPDEQNPFVKLEVITNDARAVPYWQFWINKHNVPGGEVIIGPWP